MRSFCTFYLTLVKRLSNLVNYAIMFMGLVPASRTGAKSGIPAAWPFINGELPMGGWFLLCLLRLSVRGAGKF